MPDATQPNKVNAELQRAIDALLIGERPIAYYSFLARALKSVTAGVLLSQFLYWTPRGREDEGWFYKEQKDIYAETGLTRREQETARKILKASRVVAEQRRGVPGKIYFRVDTKALADLLAAYTASDDYSEGGGEEKSHNGGKRQSTMAESDIVQWRKPAIYNGGKRQSITETTTENTDIDNSNIRRAYTQKNSGTGETVSHRRSVEQTVSQPVSPSESRSEPARPVALGALIQQRAAASHNSPAVLSRRRGRPTAAEAELRADLSRFIEDFGRELGDEAPRSSLTWAVNCMQRTGVDISTFTGVLYEARSITQSYSGGITKQADTGQTSWPKKNKFAYFKRVVEDLLGLKEETDRLHNPTASD